MPTFAQQPYGDLTPLNTCRTVLDGVGGQTLVDISADYLDLLETSAAIYETNGDYAMGLFSSGWCKFLDARSRELCETADNGEALRCGRWQCHESCWETSKLSITQGAPADCECKGGIRIYAVPIVAGGKVVGSMNFGYGSPPRDPAKLAEIAGIYQVSVEDLRSLAEQYHERSAVMVENAKKRLQMSARLLGEIIERRQAEARLEASQSWLRLAHRIARIGTFDWDILTGQVKWTEELEALYGLPPGGFGGQYEAWRQAVHPDDIERTESLLTLAVKEGSQFDTEFRVVWPDGTVRWLAAKAATLLAPDGSRRQMVGINMDITDRKAIEEEQERLVAILERTSDVVATIETPSMTVRYINSAGEKMLGLEQANGTRRTLRQLLTGEAAERLQSDALPAAAATGTWVGEAVFLNAEAREIPVSMVLIAHPSAYTDSALFSMICRDITEAKQSEQAMVERNESLEQVVGQRTADLYQANQLLIRRTAELESMNKELEAFTYSVSHDLRSPLRRLDGFAQLLRAQHSSDLPAKALHYLERIQEGSRHMGMLIDDLLKLTRLGRSDLSLKLTSLDRLVKTALHDLAAETTGRNIEWVIAPLPFAECDPHLMRHVFTNLLSNAVKFTRPRDPAVIEVGTLQQDGADMLFVRDNGVGFSMKYAHNLFGVFQRLHSNEDFEGTGVGLAIVQRIIQRHGGRIWAEAELNRGATFYFTLAGTPPEPGAGLARNE